MTVSTLQGEEYTLTSGHAADIADLLLLFLNGLKVRSEYAVSLLNSPKQGMENIETIALVTFKANAPGNCLRTKPIP